jgi:hypothetical protein
MLHAKKTGRCTLDRNNDADALQPNDGAGKALPRLGGHGQRTADV